MVIGTQPEEQVIANQQQSTKDCIMVALDIANMSSDAAVQLVKGERLNTKTPKPEKATRR